MSQHRQTTGAVGTDLGEIHNQMQTPIHGIDPIGAGELQEVIEPGVEQSGQPGRGGPVELTGDADHHGPGDGVLRAQPQPLHGYLPHAAAAHARFFAEHWVCSPTCRRLLVGGRQDRLLVSC